MGGGSRFLRHCLNGLQGMYIPSEHVFAASYRLAGSSAEHMRDPNLEYRYTLHALVGLHQARAHGSPVPLDVQSDYLRLCERPAQTPASAEDVAVTVWAGTRLGVDVPRKVMSLFHTLAEGAGSDGRLNAKDLAWLIIACSEYGEECTDRARRLAELAVEKYYHEGSGLVRQVPGQSHLKSV